MNIEILLFTMCQVALGSLIFLSSMAMILFLFIISKVIFVYLQHKYNNYLNKNNNTYR